MQRTNQNLQLQRLKLGQVLDAVRGSLHDCDLELLLLVLRSA
jgi:hypothetical protein